MPTPRRLLPTLTLLALAACSTYDFDQARLPNGGFDVKKLIADLESSGRESLDEGIWIPLIHLDLRTFEKNDGGMPEGYKLTHLKSFGPAFCIGSLDQKVVDRAGLDIEARDHEWAGWTVLYRDGDTYVDTTHGTRHEKSQRFLLFFGDDSTTYANLRSDPSNAGN